MAKIYYAVLDGTDEVRSVVEFDSLFFDSNYFKIIDASVASVGQMYNRVTEVFYDKPAPVLAPLRKITVGAFYDRLDTKLDTLLEMADNLAVQGDYSLKGQLMRLDKREFIDLDDQRLRPGFAATGEFTNEELDLLFVDGTYEEVPEILK